jgi:hypothetical protein
VERELEMLKIRRYCLPNGIQEGILAARNSTFFIPCWFEYDLMVGQSARHASRIHIICGSKFVAKRIKDFNE